MTPVDVAVLTVAGLACGIVNSVAGGGSLVLFPALLATGMPPLAANVTNSVATWPGYVGGVFGFRDDLWSSRVVRPLAAATVIGSTLGCVLLLVTPTAAFDVVVPFLVLVATGLTAAQPWARRRMAANARSDDDDVPAVAVLSVGAAAVYGGYFGGALGVIFLAVLGLTVVGSLVRLNALKAVLSVADASVSVVVFGVFGPVGWSAVAVAAPATLLGGFVGARFARRLEERALRVGVVCLGLVVAASLFATNLR